MKKISTAAAPEFCAHGVNNTFLLSKQGHAALDPRCDAKGFCKGPPYRSSCMPHRLEAAVNKR